MENNFAMMFNKDVSKVYSKKINAVVNYILKNVNNELTLSKLADIANYSPFHFQKVFKQVSGETPKQFIIRIRLENSAHCLISHFNKSIKDIALDSGFASPATFSRAFKNYFGITADALRKLPPKKHMAIRRSISARQNTPIFLNKYDEVYWRKNLKVTVNKISSFRVAFLNASLSDTKKVQDSFKKVIQLAHANNVLVSDTKFVGIINPHARLYQTAISFPYNQAIPKDMNTTEIDEGKYAVCKITGDTLQIFHAFHSLHENWLPKSTYRIKDHFAFELLSQNPLTKSYSKIVRELYIPVEPA